MHDFVAASLKNFLHVVETFGTVIKSHDEFITIIFVAARDEAVDVDTLVRKKFS